MTAQELPQSADRPAWTQQDLYAYRHLHRFGKIEDGHFIRTKGFSTMRDLRYFESGGYAHE